MSSQITRDGGKNSKKKTAQKAILAKNSKTKAVETVVEVKLGGTKPKLLTAPTKVSANKKKLSAGKKAEAKKLEASAAASGITASGITVENTGPFGTPSAEMLASFRQAKEERLKRAKQTRRGASAGSLFLAKPPKTGRKYTIDLRIQSPGTKGYFSTGGVEPGPALVRLAKAKGLDLIAITDFYTASFVDIVQASAAKAKMGLLPGFSVCCKIGECREVFFVVLFPETFTSQDLYRVLEALNIPGAAYGDRDYILETPFAEVVGTVEKSGGIMIPSRLDKNPYRQFAIPVLVEKFGFRAFDLVHPENPEYFRERWPEGGFNFFSFSNANALAQVGNRVGKIKLISADFAGLKELCLRAGR